MKKVCGNCFSRISGNVCKKWDMSTSAPALSTTLCLSDSTVAVKEDYPDGTAVRSQDNVTVESMTTIQQESRTKGPERFFREAEIISEFRSENTAHEAFLYEDDN